jgi:D-alanyl-D-alanine carboxypeptidase
LVFYKKRVITIILIIVLLCPQLLIPGISEGRIGPGVPISARAAILIDAATGEVLFEKEADVPLPPASTTKVMTALIALEQKPLNAVMPVSENASLAPPCKINVRAHEQWPLDDLLYSILLKSANDASIVIAEGTAGSVEKFADLMNRKAAQIGARHTNFVNPHGLDEKSHYTTARDLALIFQHASRQPVFREIAATKTASITSPGSRTIFLKNHNRLLETYPGMRYGKSGYTSKAKRCFVGEASRGGRELIVCVLGSRNHFQDAGRLLDYGFQAEKERHFARSDAGLSLSDAAPAADTRGFALQAASFSDYGMAADLHAALTSRNYPSFIEKVLLDNDKTWYRVKVGYYPEWASVRKTRRQLIRDFNLHPVILPRQ